MYKVALMHSSEGWCSPRYCRGPSPRLLTALWKLEISPEWSSPPLLDYTHLRIILIHNRMPCVYRDERRLRLLLVLGPVDYFHTWIDFLIFFLLYSSNVDVLCITICPTSLNEFLGTLFSTREFWLARAAWVACQSSLSTMNTRLRIVEKFMLAHSRKEKSCHLSLARR